MATKQQKLEKETKRILGLYKHYSNVAIEEVKRRATERNRLEIKYRYLNKTLSPEEKKMLHEFQNEALRIGEARNAVDGLLEDYNKNKIDPPMEIMQFSSHMNTLDRTVRECISPQLKHIARKQNALSRHAREMARVYIPQEYL